MFQAREWANRSLDASARTRARLFGRARSAFQVCGYTGFVAAAVVATALCVQQGMSLSPLAAVTLALAAGFFGLAMLVKVLIGREDLVYYHHEIAALTLAAILLQVLRVPALPYLDVTALGIGTFLVFGRVGCLLVGCCHGSPARLGIRYRDQHAWEGFPAHLVGVRLFPIQLVESLFTLVVVGVGAALVMVHAPAGSAFVWYVTAYACGRFLLEFARGDVERRFFAGFYEAQWTSLAVAASVLVGAGVGALPWYRAQAAATVWLVTALAATAGYRHVAGTMRHRLTHPGHVGEVARIVLWPPTPRGGDVGLMSTSLGINISAGGGPGDGVYHYALSGERVSLTESGARVLAGLICRIRHPAAGYTLVTRGHGVFHVLVPAGDAVVTLG